MPIVLIATAACSSIDERAWKDISVASQEKIDLSLTKSDFHQLVVGDKSVQFSHPGYIVGIEEADHTKVGWPRFDDGIGDTEADACGTEDSKYSKYCLDIGKLELPDDPRLKVQDLLEVAVLGKLFHLSKTPFVSHIIKFEGKAEGNTKRRFVYNAYDSRCLEADDNPKRPARPQLPLPCNLYTLGWHALLDTLKAELVRDIEEQKTTHLLLFSTGWKNNQVGSLATYDEHFKNLLAAYQADKVNPPDVTFNPIFIGLTWPSYWANVFGLIYADMYNNANDADEIGLLWANLLLNQVLLPLKKRYDLKVVLVGHSFGVRLLVRAANSGGLFSKRNEQHSGKNLLVDLLVGVQGAVSARKFVGDNAPYCNQRQYVDHSIYTTSKNDEVLNNPFIRILVALGFESFDYVGSEGAFEWARVTSACQGAFRSVRYDGKDGFPDNKFDCQSAPVTVVNADEVISAHVCTPSNEAGAEDEAGSSCTPGVGKLIWSLIRSCTYAPAR